MFLTWKKNKKGIFWSNLRLMAALDAKICTLGNCFVVVYLSPECRDDEKKIFSLFNSSHGNLFLHIVQTKNELWKYKTLYRLSG